MEFEDYEAQTYWLSEQMMKKGFELISERKLPLDLLAPAIEFMSLDIMKTLINTLHSEHGPEVASEAITGMFRAQTESLQAKAEWLNTLRPKL